MVKKKLKAKKEEEQLELDVNISPAFTHFLKCSHCIGRNVSIYYMKCTLLKVLPNGRAKIEVYGERNWKHREHLKRIRYTQLHRIKDKKHFIHDQLPLKGNI